MDRVYRALLKLYPYDFRAAFGAEMLAAFARVDADRRGAEMAGLPAGAASEWIAKLTSDPAIRARILPDLRLMRPSGMPRELWFGPIACSSDTSR
ncbi:MAG TPA: hypothetical protein VN924_23045 [Bryobacteraceae bacterium]|nr:hypothetical protein [Bryobacteraceae bacterium]